MIVLYNGGGASVSEIFDKSLSDDDWAKLRKSACTLLRNRNGVNAAQRLEELIFEVRQATNFFHDDFYVLYLKVPVDQYASLAGLENDKTARGELRQIAETVSEIGPFIRFIVLVLDKDAEQIGVPSPTLKTTSLSVSGALADAEWLIQARGATSGVDRIHTAFHGYLQTVCKDRGIGLPTKCSITDALKAIRNEHPVFQRSGSTSSPIDRVLSAVATIVDALNPLRNNASLAHPNDSLLPESEAMLVINTVRSLLHYFDSKLHGN